MVSIQNKSQRWIHGKVYVTETMFDWVLTVYSYHVTDPFFRVNLHFIVTWTSRETFARNRRDIWSVCSQTKWLWVRMPLQSLSVEFCKLNCCVMYLRGNSKKNHYCQWCDGFFVNVCWDQVVMRTEVTAKISWISWNVQVISHQFCP